MALVKQIRSIRGVRQIGQVSLDFLASLVTLLVVFDFQLFSLVEQVIIWIGLPLLHVGINYLFNSYKQLWRYVGLREIQNLVYNTILVSAGLVCLSTFSLFIVPMEAIIQEAALFLFLTVMIRAIRRGYVLLVASKQAGVTNYSFRTLFIGGGRTSLKIIEEIDAQKVSVNVLGCLDDDPKKHGALLGGVKILGGTEQLARYVKELDIEQVIVAIPSISDHRLNAWLTEIRQLQCKVKVVPGLAALVRNRQANPQFNFRVQDLLDAKEFEQTKSDFRPNKDVVLVTGGAGYIGLHLVKKLLDDGKKVRVLENFSFGRSFLPDFFKDPNLEVIEGDIANIRDVVQAVKGVDTVIALAAIVGDPACSVSTEDTLNLNYEASKVLIETSNFYGVRRFIFASSCSVYGASDEGYLTEESKLNPVSLYARTRIMSEDVIFDRCGQVEPVVLRLSTVFGLSPRMRFDLVVNLLTAKAVLEKQYQVFGPSQWRPFIHCFDVAEAFFLASKADASVVANQVFNVGSTDQNMTLGELGLLIKQIVPEVDYGIKEDVSDIRNYKVNFDKIYSQLGFQTSISVEQGVRDIIDAIRQDPKLLNYQDHVYSNYQQQLNRVKVSL